MRLKKNHILNYNLECHIYSGTWLLATSLVSLPTSSHASLKEDFLRQTFNCPRPADEKFQLAAGPLKESEVPDFEETDAETSDDSDSNLRATDSEEAVLAATDDECPDAPASSRAYSRRRQDKFEFLGKAVCSRACSRLLGVGQNTIQKLRQGEAVFTMKERAPLPKHPTFGFALRGECGQKWASVVLFLWLVYHSSAESLPTDFVSAFKNSQSEESDFPQLDHEERDEVLRSVNGFMRSLHQYNSDIEAHMIGPGFFRGERRNLPHGTRTELFFEYRAYCNSVKDDNPASYSTFLRIANKVFGGQQFLHFRKPSEHAVCDVCTRLKRSIRFRRGVLSSSGTGTSADSDAVKSYTSHILHQWLDRQCYWSLRTLSQAWFRRETDLAEQSLCHDFGTMVQSRNL